MQTTLQSLTEPSTKGCKNASAAAGNTNATRAEEKTTGGEYAENALRLGR